LEFGGDQAVAGLGFGGDVSSFNVYPTPSGRWRAQVVHKRVNYHVGLFGTPEAAEAACREEIARIAIGQSALVRGDSITVDKFAKEIGVRAGTVKRWVHEGMPVDRECGTVRIIRKDAKAWIADNRAGSVAFKRQSSLYIAQRASDGAVKVGWTVDVHRRMKEIAQAVGNDVYLIAALPGDKPAELRVHDRLAPHRIDGEWFAVAPDVAVKALVEEAA